MPTKRDLRRAQAEAALEFGPARQAISAALLDARTAKKVGVRQARQAAKGSIKAAKAYQADITRNYADAAADLAQTAADVKKVSGSTSDVAGELARAAARNTQDELLDRNENTARIQEAREGRRGDVRAIRQTYRSDLSEIQDKLSALGDQTGAFLVKRISELTDARKDRRAKILIEKLGNEADLTKTRLNNQNDLDVAAINNADDGGGGGGGGTTKTEPATRPQLKEFQTEFTKALSFGREMKSSGWTRAEAAQALRTGRNATKDAGAIPVIDDPLVLKAALQQVWLGHVRVPLANRIRKQRGVKPYALPGATKPKIVGAFDPDRTTSGPPY